MGPDELKSKSPGQAKLMRKVANGFQPPGRRIDVEVAKSFVRGDESRNAHKTREGRLARKRHLDDWANA